MWKTWSERLIGWSEEGRLPDPLLRAGIRQLLRQRLRQEERQAAAGGLDRFVREMDRSPVALATRRANEQHYEVPPAFFQWVLGPRLKYSCCHWSAGVQSLAGAEEAMLERTCRRAGIEDGMEVLELGCGWGSLTLWVAERFPRCRVTAVSNSRPQGEFLREAARSRGLDNVTALTADMNDFAPHRRFDRVVSVEMFEHMRNWRELLGRIAGWLVPEGRLFVHVFCHRRLAYPFEVDGRADWMARYFFTGGLMPSQDLLGRFDADLVVRRQWSVNGRHYAKTAAAWRETLDLRRGAVTGLFRDLCGSDQGERWFHRWRLFFLACEELFAYRGGSEWKVAHYLLGRRGGARDQKEGGRDPC